MAKKRIMNLAVEGSRADLVSGNFVALDGPGGTKKIPAYFVRGDFWVFNCPFSQQLGDYTWPDWDVVQDALNGGFNVALRLYAQGQFNFYVCTGRAFEENDQEESLSVYKFLDVSSGMAYVIKYNNDTDTWGTPTGEIDSPSVLWTMQQTLTDQQKLQGRNNIGAAALASLAASFESRAPSYNWSAGEVCTYGGKLWQFDANHGGAWTGADAHEIDVEDMINVGLSDLLNIDLLSLITDWEDITSYIVYRNNFQPYYQDDYSTLKAEFSPSTNLVRFGGHRRALVTSKSFPVKTWMTAVDIEHPLFYGFKVANIDDMPKMYRGLVYSAGVSFYAGVDSTGSTNGIYCQIGFMNSAIDVNMAGVAMKPVVNDATSGYTLNNGFQFPELVLKVKRR